MSTPSPAARDLHPVEVPLGPAVVPRLLPPLEQALARGPAMLPLPAGPEPVRRQLIAALRPDEPLERPDVALVVPTSGSTGEPKGVLLTSPALQASAAATAQRLGGPGRWLLALPATYVAGLMVLVRSVLGGTTPVVLDLTSGFEPEAFAAASLRLFGDPGWEPARRYTSLVPTQLVAILEAGGAAVDALAGYDAVLVGGGEPGAGLVERARAAGARVVVTYGMTETCGGCVYDGVALDGVDVDVRADGRIRLAGPMLAAGYRLRPDATARAFADDWFTTTDVGRLDDHGVLTVLGRTDDVTISGGVNVSLSAVDTLVSDHPAVSAALAVAVPDGRWGRRVVVAVVPRDPAEPPTLDALRTHVKQLAPAAYAPQEMLVVDSIPVLPGGKPDRRALTAVVERALATTPSPTAGH